MEVEGKVPSESEGKGDGDALGRYIRASARSWTSLAYPLMFSRAMAYGASQLEPSQEEDGAAQPTEIHPPPDYQSVQQRGTVPTEERYFPYLEGHSGDNQMAQALPAR